MFRPPTKYSEYLQDVQKSIDYILRRVNSKTVNKIVAGSNVTISPEDGTGNVTINASGGVSQIIAGSNITVSPAEGTGVVTISSTGGGSGTNSNVLIDGGNFISTENVLIDAGAFV